MPKIANIQKDMQKPSFVKVISVPDDYNKDNLPSFYVYTGVGVQSVVFKRKWEEVSPTVLDEGDSVNISKISDDTLSKKNMNKKS